MLLDWLTQGVTKDVRFFREKRLEETEKNLPIYGFWVEYMNIGGPIKFFKHFS